MDKRLYRSSHDRVFLGVCGGIGEYFNVDPGIIRVITVVITLITAVFPGIVAYLIIALIVPLEGSMTSSPRDNIRENLADMRDTTAQMGQDIQTSLGNRQTKTGPVPAPTASYNGAIVLGLIVIALGILFLVGNIFGWFWRFAWPILLILAGLVIILLVTRRK